MGKESRNKPVKRVRFSHIVQVHTLNYAYQRRGTYKLDAFRFQVQRNRIARVIENVLQKKIASMNISS